MRVEEKKYGRVYESGRERVYVCISIESSGERIGNINMYGIIRLTLYAATASAPSYAMLHSMPFRFKRMESILQLDTASAKAKSLKR